MKELDPIVMAQADLVELANIGQLGVHIWKEDFSDYSTIEPPESDPTNPDLFCHWSCDELLVQPLTDRGFEALAVWAAVQLGELDRLMSVMSCW